YCTIVGNDGTTRDFPSRSDRTENTSVQLGKSDQVKGGFALGNVRAALSFDYAVTSNFLLGARAGFVFLGTYPGQAAGNEGKGFGVPIHLEARGTLLIGNDALNKGVAPMVFLGAGIGE